ncbi:hypothetical protein FGE12_27825 [Aggregicoccus sp. 17bor-14]|uniref:hypothetical protein n=1 Tax=Myxococcaceae TaxID=31 RepID=UPI00129C1B43|nr:MULTISPECIES: hypothetical protein [Myxococcaceae]MBF5046257.1 hypothetical protein [Simulacricoccus sp. 17bor-14]MRI91980.1 hypothetical protein [Aggregicoccus sp. 17bor-14]
MRGSLRHCLGLFAALALSGCASRGETLAHLRADRQWLQDAPASEESIERGGYSVRSLVGTSREELRAQLGTPERVFYEEERQVEEYVFTRLAPGSFGLGRVLRLEFDAAGRCSRARWTIYE